MPKQGGQGKGKPKLADRSFGISLKKSQLHKSTKINVKSSAVHSILDQSSLDDYIMSSEMNESDIEVIKRTSDIQFISTKKSNTEISFNGLNVFKHVDVPRRPLWNRIMSTEELHRSELESFIQWRGYLSKVEESYPNFTLTPFEKNIDVWRQLWRVIEKCNLLIQIVDARNPLFYYSNDLHCYIKELNLSKECIILINKADYLTPYQRQMWAAKLEEMKLVFLFYSAKLEDDNINQDIEPKSSSDDIKNIVHSITKKLQCEGDENQFNNSAIINKSELLVIFESVLSYLSAKNPSEGQEKLWFGFIGYPNVGKSSVINNILNVSRSYNGPRSSVSSTPGRTKHMQTFVLANGLTLCDCPGLVFPSFMNNTGEMLCSGVLPINNMRDFNEPATAIAIRVPKEIIEAVYGINILKFDLDISDNQDRAPTAHEILSAYCKVKGYITNGTGRWDEFRATKDLLRDFCDGILLYVTPPDIEHLDFQIWMSETAKTIMQNKKIMNRFNMNVLKRESKIVELNASCGSFEMNSLTVDDNVKERDHKRIPHWGKKNRKLRDKNPYNHGTDSYLPLFKNRNPNSMA